MDYKGVTAYLENLTIMPKTMPGLEKIRQAVAKKKWFKDLDPQKIITVAGTNGKGTTCAALEALLINAGRRTGLYTSPHLVSTTERVRVNGKDVSENLFIEVFLKNKTLIEKHGLSHFESLTLMAADIFFSSEWGLALDYYIFEVGLGGLHDATNIFPNHYSIITKMGLDHENILGRNLTDIARNKFGIIKKNSIVFHHELDPQLDKLIDEVKQETSSVWIPAEKWQPKFKNGQWGGESQSTQFQTNLIGERAIENIATAITVFKKLGYEFQDYKSALKDIHWPGRMQKVDWPSLPHPIYLSGDHNIQGIESLISILKNYNYKNLHMIVGIGADKACDEMLTAVLNIPQVKLYLTETPFKGRSLQDYPLFAQKAAVQSNSQVENILNSLKPEDQDMIVVSGSLYLVGQVLSQSK